MLELLYTIIATSCIFLAFKSHKIFGIDSLQAIVVNYFVCVISGLIFLNKEFNLLFSLAGFKVWYLLAILLGALFIYTFIRMSRTATEISVSASSMASKLALVLPVIFSLIVLQRTSKNYDFINYTGILLTIPALLLASWPEKDSNNSKILKRIGLPLSVFVLSGIIDTCLNYFNAIFEEDPGFVFFPVLVFFIAGLGGLIYALSRGENKAPWKLKSFVGGLYLGIPNFFSLYFLLETLRIFNQDGAFIFPISNLGTILLSGIGAYILFKEKLNFRKLSGLILACLALYLLAYQEINQYF